MKIEPKSVFADRVNALGQPGGNGIPDILDEAKWGLDWMLKLHPAPTNYFIKLPMIAIIRAGVCRKMKRSITAGARARSASFILPTANRRV